MEMIPGMRGIWQLFPGVRLRIVYIKPGHMTIDVAVGQSAQQIDFIIIDYCPCTTPRTGNFRTIMPRIVQGIINNDLIDRIFIRESTGECSQDIDQIIELHRLIMMKQQRRGRANGPCVGVVIIYVDIGTMFPAAHQVELIPGLHESGLMPSLHTAPRAAECIT